MSNEERETFYAVQERRTRQRLEAYQREQERLVIGLLLGMTLGGVLLVALFRAVWLQLAH